MRATGVSRKVGAGQSAATTDGEVATACTVHDNGVRLRVRGQAVLDVLFEGHRVWSFHPARDSKPDGPAYLAAWPRALRPFLNGAAAVSVVEHVSRRVLFDDTVMFGDGDGAVRIVDGEGRPLAVAKNGDLEITFTERGTSTVGPLLDGIVRVLRLIQQEGGLPGFLAFGGLLGAVRDGKLIGHDSDADVSYISAHRNPADVMRESFELERIMKRAGYTTRRFSAADFKVFVPDPEGGREIDIFAGFVVGETFYIMPTVWMPYRESMFLPLGEVTLEGRAVPAPADPEGLLEATYGPDWRVPDPSFHYKVPPPLLRRLDGWMRGDIANRGHWWPFYAKRASAAVSTDPSPFARWVAEQEPSAGEIIDIGSGTGRDALWFARQGHRVLGLDYAPAATRNAELAAREAGIPAHFRTCNLYDIRQILAHGGLLAHRDQPATLYGRFLLHALRDEGRHRLWLLASMALRRGGRFYLEFRTGADAKTEHEFGEHFRKYLDPDVVVGEIEERGGHIEDRIEGRGLAVYKDEDPHVCRLAVTWKR